MQSGRSCRWSPVQTTSLHGVANRFVVNLVLFETTETESPLPRADARAVHVLDVLRRREGDSFDIGRVNGPRGKAVVRRITDGHLELEFHWGAALPPRVPLTLMIGLPRPQTARKILMEAATLGVSTLHFVSTERSDPNYAASTLWSSGEWRRHVLAGAAQAFDTRIPEVTWTKSLQEAAREQSVGAWALENGPSPKLLALDNYEAGMRLGEVEIEPRRPVCLALGPERGWGASDRETLRAHGFSLAHLGEPVLRTETALVVALGIVAARQGRM